MIRDNPREGLTKDKIDAMCRDYVTMTDTPVRTIASNHSRSSLVSIFHLLDRDLDLLRRLAHQRRLP